MLCCYYWPWLTNQQSFYQSDITYYFEPFTRFIVEGYRHGRIPLWNPYLYCGMAQVAVPSPGLFYPPALLFLLMSFSQGLASYLVLHQLIAGAGAFLLIASFGWGLSAALVAGLSCGLCGYFFALTDNFTLVATAAWLPLLVYLVRTVSGTIDAKNVLRVGCLAACLGCLIGAGRPEVSVPACLLLGIVVLLEAWNNYSAHAQDIKAALPQLAMRLVGLGLGVLLAMPIILPAVEWVPLSPRSHGLDLKWVLMWSANWYDFLLMFLPQPLGDLTVLGNRYLNLGASRLNAIPYLTSSYVGPVVTTLALWGLFDRNWRWRWHVLAIFIAGLLMAMGNNTPIAPAVCNLTPAFAAFRYPVKLMIFPVLSLIVMAARGASLASSQSVSKGGLAVTSILVGLLFVLGLCFFGAPGLSYYAREHHLVATSNTPILVLQGAQTEFGIAFLSVAALMAAVILGYRAFCRQLLSPLVFSGALCSCLVITLMVPAMLHLRHGTVSDFFRRADPLAAHLRALTAGRDHQKIGSRVLTLYFDPLTPGADFQAEQKLNFQQSFYLFARLLLLPNSNVDFHIPYSYGYEAAEVGMYKQLFIDALANSSQNREFDPKQAKSDAPIARFCQITSAHHVLTQAFRHKLDNKVALLDARYFRLRSEDNHFNVRIYDPVATLPRAYFAKSIVWKASQESFLSRMLDVESTGMIDKTYVEGAPVPLEDTVETASTVTFLDDAPEHVALSATTKRPQLLVLTDQFYPGWSATIDGAPTNIRRVNFFARGVVIPIGTHTVNFVYSPESLWSGVCCAFAAFVFFLLALASALIKSGRGSEQTTTQ